MYQVDQMTRPQVEERIRQYPVAILPVGSCEQHGPHLPLGTDTMMAVEPAKRISRGTGALVFPPMHFGYSWVWRDIAGTGSVDHEHLKAVLMDLCEDVGRYGIRLLVMLNGYEANNTAIKYALREAQDETSVKLLGMFYPGLTAIY